MRERIIANFDTFLRSFEIEKFETQMYIYQRSIILGYLDVDRNIEGYVGTRDMGQGQRGSSRVLQLLSLPTIR